MKGERGENRFSILCMGVIILLVMIGCNILAQEVWQRVSDGMFEGKKSQAYIEGFYFPYMSFIDIAVSYTHLRAHET